jgi:proton-translocating NADH-quinone oxidoreductase chain M
MDNFSNILDIPATSLLAMCFLSGNILLTGLCKRSFIWKLNVSLSTGFILIFATLYILDMLTNKMSTLSLIYCLSLLFLLGTTVTLSSKIILHKRLFFSLLHLTIFLLIGAFSTDNIIVFYFFFEAALLPVYIIIIVWGSREEKSSAAYQFFLYTLLGSICLLVSIIYLVNYSESVNILTYTHLSYEGSAEYFLFILFFLAFAVKIPMFPLHLWLPKAHVEAPTIGSILLAGILLKLGSYGFLRYNLVLFPNATIFFEPFIIILSICGIIFASFTILRQIDLKRIIAYASIIHMNLVVLGCFTNNYIVVVGSILLTLAHGLASSGLFACVGFIYDRLKTRNILYIRALALMMPIQSFFFLFFILSDTGFPPSLNFVAELFLIIGLIDKNIIIIFIILYSLFLSFAGALWIFTRIQFADTFEKTLFNKRILTEIEGKNEIRLITRYRDLTIIEFFCFLPLVLYTVILSVISTQILMSLTFSSIGGDPLMFF